MKTLTNDQAAMIHETLLKATEDMQDFVNKVENGQAKSVNSYNRFKDTLPKLTAAIKNLQSAM